MDKSFGIYSASGRLFGFDVKNNPAVGNGKGEHLGITGNSERAPLLVIGIFPFHRLHDSPDRPRCLAPELRRKGITLHGRVGEERIVVTEPSVGCTAPGVETRDADFAMHQRRFLRVIYGHIAAAALRFRGAAGAAAAATLENIAAAEAAVKGATTQPGFLLVN